MYTGIYRFYAVSFWCFRRIGKLFILGGIFVKKVRVSFLLILAALVLLHSTSVYALTGSSGLTDYGNTAGAQGSSVSGDQRTDADAQTGLQEEPVNGRQIILVKIAGGGDEMIKVSLDDLVLDIADCTYEPEDREVNLVISKNVLITADNIILTDAVIEGDLYINADNAVLRNLNVNGTIYIDPSSGKGLRLDNVTSGNLAVRIGHYTDTGSDSGDGDENAGGAADDSRDEAADNAGGKDDDDDTGKSINDNADRIGEQDKDEPGEAGDGGVKKADTGKDESKDSNEENIKENDKGSGREVEEKTTVSNKNLKAYLQVADIDGYDSTLVVVSKTRSLPADWRPKDLVMLRVNYRGRAIARYMRKEASDALTRLFADAAKEGIELCAVSGYRSYALQEIVFNKHSDQLGLEAAMRVSALPGQSEHQTGLAIDISSKTMNYGLDKSFAVTREGKWLAANAAKYGFILRYPQGKEQITGYDYEPWHFRYVGVDLALDIMKKGLTMEEYFGIAEADAGNEDKGAAPGKEQALQAGNQKSAF